MMGEIYSMLAKAQIGQGCLCAHWIRLKTCAVSFPLADGKHKSNCGNFQAACRRLMRLPSVYTWRCRCRLMAGLSSSSCLCRDTGPAVLLSGGDGQQVGTGICLVSWPVPGSGQPGRAFPCLPCSAVLTHYFGVTATRSQSVQVCCLQGRLVLGEHESSGWERTLAGELLGSSSSRLPRLTLQGPLPQTLAGSTGESLHVCSEPKGPAHT